MDHNLSNRPKLLRAVEAERQQGINITVELLGHGKTAGIAEENRGVILNNYYLRVDVPNYPEDRLIVVLYHEIGHMRYFASCEAIDRTCEDSEYWAFENSLLEGKRLAETENDSGPLSTALFYIAKRKESGDEKPHYQTAIDRIVDSELWSNCKKIVEQGSGGNG